MVKSIVVIKLCVSLEAIHFTVSNYSASRGKNQNRLFDLDWKLELMDRAKHQSRHYMQK